VAGTGDVVDAMPEHFLVKGEGGAIGYLGFAGTGHPHYRDDMYDRFFNAYSHREWMRLGDKWRSMIVKYLDMYFQGATIIEQNLHEYPNGDLQWGYNAMLNQLLRMHLFGDPSLILGGIRFPDESPCVDQDDDNYWVSNPSVGYDPICEFLPEDCDDTNPDVNIADGDGDGFDCLACGGDDCDDINSDVYPGAPEICDCIDNQCPGDSGYGEIDERGVCGPCSLCTATAEASVRGSNRAHSSVAPLKHLAYFLLPIGAIFVSRILRTKR
jgi:hypothetical protein